ncbi:NADPH-dependent FMN reductase [Thioalkalivibrio sp. XN8]|uniref:NADPH-dependent FMN reductase n=1 Tax=Thioalkalivibrio sp. XN8 TaxID=2712863 RepID=UPI0013EB4FD6|nr:NADPH-dependent FMN reductase [Thioalkalivibrio sp. XN8]NGP54690.1 NAD(P)H-dependent oxidoreductase [Thioalkalivibrio sp. XN8]
MGRLLAISGSLRARSFNTALAHAAQALVAPGIEIEVATLHGIPLYDGDLEEGEGIPPAVEALKDRIRSSAGLILVTPEYNSSIPGVFKNAVDWLSRPGSGIKELFGDKPCVVIGATPGGFGTIMSQAAWLPVLRALGVRYWSGGRLLVSRASSAFDEQGGLADEMTRQLLEDFIRGFHAFSLR